MGSVCLHFFGRNLYDILTVVPEKYVESVKIFGELHKFNV